MSLKAQFRTILASGALLCEHDYLPDGGEIGLYYTESSGFQLVWTDADGQPEGTLGGLWTDAEALNAYEHVRDHLSDQCYSEMYEEVKRQNDEWLRSERAWEHPPLPPVIPALMDNPSG